MSFTAAQLEAAIESLEGLDKQFPESPISLDVDIWYEDSYPVLFKKVGDDTNVSVRVEDYFGGEEGGDHAMYIIFSTGYGENKRYFEKTGEYNSWDSSEWDGGFSEVYPIEVVRKEWTTKKP